MSETGEISCKNDTVGEFLESFRRGWGRDTVLCVRGLVGSYSTNAQYPYRHFLKTTWNMETSEVNEWVLGDTASRPYQTLYIDRVVQPHKWSRKLYIRPFRENNNDGICAVTYSQDSLVRYEQLLFDFDVKTDYVWSIKGFIFEGMQIVALEGKYYDFALADTIYKFRVQNGAMEICPEPYRMYFYVSKKYGILSMIYPTLGNRPWLYETCYPPYD